MFIILPVVLAALNSNKYTKPIIGNPPFRDLARDVVAGVPGANIILEKIGLMPKYNESRALDAYMIEVMILQELTAIMSYFTVRLPTRYLKGPENQGWWSFDPYKNSEDEIDFGELLPENRTLYYDGTYEEFDKEGRLRRLTNFSKGKINGIRKEWHPNGNLRYQGVFDMGRTVLEGEYFEDGRVRKEIDYFSNGQKKQELKFHEEVEYQEDYLKVYDEEGKLVKHNKWNTSGELINDEKRTHISFVGSSWLLVYNLGVGTVIQEKMDTSKCDFGGCSSGSIVSTIMAADYDCYKALDIILDMVDMCREREHFEFIGACGFMSEILGTGLDRLLSEISMDNLDDRLFISITTLPLVKNLRVSSFYNKQDLRDAIFASCYVPLYYEDPVSFRGNFCVDGALTDINVIRGDETLLISPFTTTIEAQIRPEEDFDFGLFFYPDRKVLKEIFDKGREHGLAYFG